jgi:pimeloyl-ACP methyl ester carboxylesterase
LRPWTKWLTPSSAITRHRPRPRDLSGLRKNVRQRNGRWYWRWDPRFVGGRLGATDETRTTLITPDRLEAAASGLAISVLLVRGLVSDLLSEAGARALLELVPQAELVNVAGAGHMVAGDRNDLFNEAIVRFLSGIRT